MLNVCLKSVCTKFKQMPHIYVATDLSLDEPTCRKALNWLPAGSFSIVSGLDCLKYHQGKGNTLLAKFARKNPLGLKLAAILQVVESGKPVLYSDTDVIWYQDPASELNALRDNPRCHISLSADVQAAYDETLIEKLNLNSLKNAPFYCTGIAFFKELKEHHYALIDKLLPAAADHSNHFTEQTILAFLNTQAGNFNLDSDQFVIDLSGKQDFFPRKSKNIIARHYVGEVRHLFWRDALFN